MKSTLCSYFKCGLTAFALCGAPLAAASAHIVLAQPDFQPGVDYAALFKVEHGCDGSPTIRLRIEMPPGVEIVKAPPMRGWTVTLDQKPSAVTWRGKLDAAKAEQFALLLKLPMKTGALYFPALQTCETGEVKWTDTPASGQSPAKLAHPAPVLVLGAPGDMTAMASMPGMAGHAAAKPNTTTTAGSATHVAISDAWIRSLAGGVPAGGYFKAHNAGPAKVTMTGAESSACGMVMLHKTMKMAGMADMEEIATVDIPPNGDVVFAPGGYHLMCMKPSSAVKPGATVALTFLFSDGSKANAAFAVRDAKGN